MKSFFTKLGKLLLCGVAVAVVGCTDYDTDIQNVNDRLDGLKQETTATAEDLAEAIAALEAKLATQYATKEYVDGLNKEVKDQLTKDVTALSGRIDAANKAIEDAVATVSTQLSALDDKKADKTALNEAVKAIEDLEKELNTVKTDLEGEIETVKTQIADAKAELNEKIAGVDAKANELQNTLVSLSEYLGGLEAKVNEINNTLLSLSEYLPKMKAELEAKINAVDAKAEENYNTLVSLSEHLTEYEATTDLKLTELHGSLAALSTYLETYEAEVDAKFTEIRNTLDSLSEYLKKKFGELDATDTDLYMEIDGLREVITSINNLLALETENREAADEALEAKIQELRNTLLSLEPVIASLQNENNELWKQYNELQANVGQIYTSLTERINATDAALAAHKAAYETKVAEIEAKINELNNTLLSLSEYLPEMKAALEAKINELRSTLVSLEPVIDNLQNEDVQLQQQITELQNNLAAALNVHDDDVAAIYAALKENTEELAGQIQTTQNALSSALLYINMNSENIEKLMSQVQSLVYVPVYSDHKATIEWAQIAGSEIMTANYDAEAAPSYVIVSKLTKLDYVVKANTVADAESAAQIIATNWKTSLDYLVQPVSIRTKADAPAADLEIVNVTANKDVISVYVYAKNFDPKFYENDREGIYSAAIVLNDNDVNNLTSEYTNLVPGEAEMIRALIIDGTEAKKDITGLACPESEQVNLLPYDLDPKEVVVLKDHALSFVWEGKNYSAAELIANGYDIQLERRQYFTYPDADKPQSLYRVDGKPQDFAVLGDDVKFQIHEKDFVSEIEEGNTTVTLTRALTKAEYLALEDKTLDIKFVYNVNGLEVSTESAVEICNRLVEVNLGVVEIPWTMELAYNLHGETPYSLPVQYTGYEYDLAACVTNNKSLEGYSLYSILQTGSPKKTYGGTGYDIQMSIADETLDFTLSGEYAFPEPTSANDWNEYTVQWVNEFDDLSITVKAAIKLGKRTDALVASESDLEFKLAAGVNGWVYAYSTIVEQMFEKYRDIIGFADDDEAAMEFFSARLADSPVSASKINKDNTVLDPQNIDTPINAFEPLKIGLHQSQIDKDAAKQEIMVSQKDAIVGVEYTFNFDGTIVLPTDGLEYSTVDYVNFNADEDRWEVEVDGDIIADETVEHGRKYTIDQADLGKYFYVNEEVEYGVERVLTVKFEIKTENAPKPETTDVVNVFVDETSKINVLEEGKAVIKDWTHAGLFEGNEIEVTATLLANGFPVDTKDVTLFTIDPLTFSEIDLAPEVEDVEILVERVPGEDAVAYTHRALSLTSIEEKGNLINTESYPSQVFVDKYANEVYGAKFITQPADHPEWNCDLIRVYTKEGENKVTYPGVKYTFNNGKITLKADDGLLNQSIYADVEYKLTHNYNYGNDESVVITVEFRPNNEN